MRNYLRGIYLIEKIYREEGKPFLYIGQSKDIFGRFNSHCSGASDSPLDLEISNSGVSSFIFKVLEVVDGQKERNQAEKKYIKLYSEKYGLGSLYNLEDGGKIGKSRLKDMPKTSPSQRLQLVSAFSKRIDYPIYLLAERLGLHFQTVIGVRKPFLKASGYRYDFYKRSIVSTEDGSIPENWVAGVFTQNQIDRYFQLANKLDLDSLSVELNCSVADLREFIKEYSEKYIAADSLVLQKNF